MGLPLGPYPSWMNSSRAAHSDTSWGSPLLSTTKDRMGSRSSAPLLNRGTLAGQLQGPVGLLNRPNHRAPSSAPEVVWGLLPALPAQTT